MIFVLLLVGTSLVFANGEIIERESSTSIVRIIVVAIGGIVSILGIVVAYKGIGGKADVELSVSEQKKIIFKNVSQGVVITIIGAMILIAAVYFLPEKGKERRITGKEITIERSPDGRTREVMKK
jgi:hypothetical protein